MARDASKALEGHCLCGRVRLRAVPEALDVDACHCGMCRRWGGGPCLTIPCGTAVTITQDGDALTVFDSSEWAQRGFCRACGSHLFYRLRAQGLYFVSAGVFGEVEGVVFRNEIFVDHKPGWYDFANPTRRMTGAEVVALFDGG